MGKIREKTNGSPTKEVRNVGSSTVMKSEKKKTASLPCSGGFPKGLRPDKIVGATENEQGVLCFSIKCKDSTHIEILPAREANAACPQLVIQFYEGLIQWTD